VRISIAIGMITKQDSEVLLENSGSVCPKIWICFKFYILSAEISVSCLHFLSRVSTAMLTRDIDCRLVAILFVCLSRSGVVSIEAV